MLIVSDVIIVEDPEITCDPITSSSECEAAAEYLGLSDIPAKPSPYQYIDPPYCFFESGRLLFNADGQNKGECDSENKCLCWNSGEQVNASC